ncbi:hypothetical protein, partial [Escherichia coli]|uniref:hypothetical protein n=1 Tax=Escherichia coli TaxID=562 RepID=UPI00207B1498
ESSDGFTFTPGDKVTCVAGNNPTIATSDPKSDTARRHRSVEKVSFSLEDAAKPGAYQHKKNNPPHLSDHSSQGTAEKKKKVPRKTPARTQKKKPNDIKKKK